MTQRPFPNVSELQVASTASSRCHTAVDAVDVAVRASARVATVSVPHRSRQQDARLHVPSVWFGMAHGRRVLAEAVAQICLRKGRS